MSKETALDERETTFTVEATDRKVLHVFSNDPVWQARLDKLGIAPSSVDGYGSIYTVDLAQYNFSIRKRRQLTDAQREALHNQLRGSNDSNSDSL